MLLIPNILRGFMAHNPPKPRRHGGLHRSARRLEDLANEVAEAFVKPIQLTNLLNMSKMFQIQFDERLQYSPVCMLPSYNYALPTGNEHGDFLAVDVGGSTLRIAWVKLSGRNDHANAVQISRMQTWMIEQDAKMLSGDAFFDWVAGKIEQMLAADGDDYKTRDDAIPMGLAWSFPFEQTSLRSGSLLSMGKGFHCAEGMEGQDLRQLVMRACNERGLKVDLAAIVNDSLAAMFSHAYLDSATRLAVIVGTGANAAIELPVSCIGRAKFGVRPESWFERAKHVVVNTELGMFGKQILPFTRWDDCLNRAHQLPDYQPFEYMISGRYIGELVRLILKDAVESAGLFGGELPATIADPYALDCRTVADIESDRTPLYTETAAILQKRCALVSHPSYADLAFVRSICQHVSHRSAALFAMSLHALWRLRRKIKQHECERGSHGSDDDKEDDPTEDRLTISCNGSVINKYPGFRERCQSYCDLLTEMDGGKKNSMVLEPSVESAILGAAVAVGTALSIDV